MWNEKTQKIENNRIPIWNEIMLFVLLFTENGEMNLCMYFFIGFWSVGTDGARTRNFRLDRAVLWPIELQSQEN